MHDKEDTKIARLGDAGVVFRTIWVVKSKYVTFAISVDRSKLLIDALHQVC